MYTKNFGPGLNWLIVTIGYVIGPVLYTVILEDVRLSLRLVAISSTLKLYCRNATKIPIPVLPSIELDVPTATSNAHAATVLPTCHQNRVLSRAMMT